ncbi:ras association domain-containing protein 10 [Pungitius pungitius]|uniref:ras association domain-containing protein 10 n=1 Tax=Pungitius pungitius TaxID=134920 RepID=UPI0018879121|nr:ras association domain-containing protein 10 [Pungitius pungitius]
MEAEEGKISVWVCREEKLVFGLSKRTACTDVVKVLLEEQNARRGLPDAPCPHSYCIVEKWRGFERTLSNKTKILRLWFAWGEEQRNVTFALVRSEASLATHGARSAEARVVLSRHRPCVTKGPARSPEGSIPPEKHRRVVRKAFRKLEKINKKRAPRDASSAEKIETLVHLVISQDHTMRQQVQRMTQLDADIQVCEAKVHSDRMEKHGVNYVQDTYSVDAPQPPRRDGGDVCSPGTVARFEEYVRRCEQVVRLQEELWEKQALVDVFAAQVQQELNHRWMQRRKQRRRKDAEPHAAPEEQLLWEEDRTRTQLEASLYVGLRLNADLEAIRSDLELTQEICAAREKEMRDLLEKVNTLDMEDGAVNEERCGSGAGDDTGVTCALERKTEWVEQARGPSKAHSVDDDDSDTGLSSLHSQDSDCHPVWESLV